MKIETILSPTELPTLARRDLRGTACVVFDILRATSTFVTALHHGAAAIIPVSEISEAVALRKADGILLAGEREGVKICAAQSGGTDFDFGNSPREFTPERVRGQTIVSTTTNGTRAVQACAGAPCVVAAAFLNLAATAKFLRANNYPTVLLVCAGTGESVADEDVLAAGALVEMLVNGTIPSTSSLQKGEGESGGAPSKLGGLVLKSSSMALDDPSHTAWETFLQLQENLSAAIGCARNGHRLLANPDLRDDVAFCAQRDIFNLVAMLSADGALRRVATS